MKPNNFQVNAQYSKRLKEKRTLFASFNMGRDGKKRIYISTAGDNLSDTIIEPDEIEDFYEFLKESNKAFETLITINKAFIQANETAESLDSRKTK